MAPHPLTARRPSKMAQQLARLEIIQSHFPTFRFTRMGRDWKYDNYPTVNGQRPAISEILAHICGSTKLRFDRPSDHTPRALKTIDPETIHPYALQS